MKKIFLVTVILMSTLNVQNINAEPMSNNSNNVQPMVLTTQLQSHEIVINKRTGIDKIIYDEAKKYILPENFLRAVIQAESNFDTKCIGPDTEFGNAYGLMQLLPSTAEELGVNDIYDPQENVEGGARYLKSLVDKYRNDCYYDENNNILTPYEMAVIAYNWGYGNLDRHIAKYGKVILSQSYNHSIPKETFGYLMKIRSHYDFDEYYN